MENRGKVLRLLPIPYPYLAMLSITNDIDCLNAVDFQELHKYFNTEEETLFGKGLNIEIGNSFWFFQHPLSTNKAFSYFKWLSREKSKESALIIELNHQGYLDCLHSWGNFSRVGGFNRRYAELAVEECLKNSIKCPVWINHGDKMNLQNMVHGEGDNPDSDCYSADFLREIGINFLWIGELTKFIGQDRKYRVKEVYFRDKKNIQYMAYTYCKLIIKFLLKGRIFSKNSNTLLKTVKLRDSQEFYSFKRYGYWEKATFSDLPFLLSDKVLSDLMLNKGKMSLYIHLGKNLKDSIYSNEIMGRLEHLARLFHEKKVLVTTTARLLKFSLLQMVLKYETLHEESKVIIRLKLPENLFYYSIPDIFQGVSFVVNKPDDYIVLFNERKIEFKLDRDKLGKKWILYYPWEKL